MLQPSIEPSQSSTTEQKRELLLQLLAQAEPEEREYRLSYAQRRIWFLEQLGPGTGVHNLSSGMRVCGDLNVPVLERALTRLVQHQSVLRSVFMTVNGEPRGRIAPAHQQRIPIKDLTRFPEQSREVEAYGIASLEAKPPFDLLTGPLIRVRL